MSSASIKITAPDGWPACSATSETTSTMTVTTPSLLRENVFRAIVYLLVRNQVQRSTLPDVCHARGASRCCVSSDYIGRLSSAPELTALD
jgi:hypothetical protein